MTYECGGLLVMCHLDYCIHRLAIFFVYFCAIEFPNLTPSALSEFSESLREMGSCLLEKTALHDDEESGK
jgi:hypothetical protein